MNKSNRTYQDCNFLSGSLTLSVRIVERSRPERRLVVEQRRAKRFEIKLPVQLVRAGLRPSSGAGTTKNLSSGGVLFATDSRFDIGDPIEYVITLTATAGYATPVTLHCLGKVMRFEIESNGTEAARPFEVAATLERYEFVRPKA
jgi:hypothetical protein